MLAVPTILIIHMLQERSRRVRVSTLFLLERVKPESIAGARVERLRSSVPLWLQILAALILTWLLAEPRWIRKDARQTVVVVLDSSASMNAFKKEMQRLLAEKLPAWTRGAAHTDWALIESAPRKPTLYAGGDLGALLHSMEKWEPLSGTHPVDDALQTARSLIRNGAGAVIFVSDHKVPLPEGIGLLSAGEVLENCGFAGVEVKMVQDHPRWSVLVKNYGKNTAHREWWMEPEKDAKVRLPDTKRTVEIEAGRTVALEGEFGEGVDRFTLVMSGDRFSLDDRLPLQRPAPRKVGIAVQLKGSAGDAIRKMLGALDGVDLGSGAPDLIVNELGTALETHGVQIALSGDDVEATLDPAWIAAEPNPLTRDLAWSSLLCAKPSELTQSPDDEPLLWKGGRLLALVRHGKKADGLPLQRLILNWDIAKSNASRLPAMLVLLQRYVERVRELRNAPWTGNFELGQRFRLADFGTEVLKKRQVMHSLVGEEPFNEQAPERPGFFEVSLDGKPFLSGAAHFADTREADFNDASAQDTTGSLRRELAMKQTEADPLLPLWELAVLGCFLGSWAWRQSRQRTEAKTAAAGGMLPSTSSL